MRIAVLIFLVFLTTYALAGAVLGQVGSAPVTTFSLDLKSLCGLLSGAVVGAYWLSRKFTNIEDRLTVQDQQRGVIIDTLTKLDKAMAGLPCRDRVYCQEPPPPKKGKSHE